MKPILSHYQVETILAGQRAGKSIVDSTVDLGLTNSQIHLFTDHISLPDGQDLTWSQLDQIGRSQLACFQIIDNALEKVHFYSDFQNRFYSLMPTEKAPTMLISGIPMHRIKGTDPHKDTLSKIAAIVPVTGEVLDTTMGLGYTAIEAARTADHVTTIELDPTVVEVCRCNPWSQELFHNPRISRLIGHAWDHVEELDSKRFTRIIHDPPMFSLAGELYAADFYRELLRLLKPNGRLFHYIGDPNSKSGGSVTRGVVKRLKAVGFRQVRSRPQAFGVVAYR